MPWGPLFHGQWGRVVGRPVAPSVFLATFVPISSGVSRVSTTGRWGTWKEVETLCNVPSSLEGRGTLWKSEEKPQEGEDAWLICSTETRKGVEILRFRYGLHRIPKGLDLVVVCFSDFSFMASRLQGSSKFKPWKSTLVWQTSLVLKLV